jgi:hypothetical protein
MIEVLSADRHLANGEGILDEILKGDLGLELVQANREVGVLHLPGQHLGQAVVAPSGCVDSEAVARDEDRPEEGETLDVVPVGVAHQNRGFDRAAALEQIEPQRSGTGSAVEDELRSGRGAKRDA